MFPRLIPPAARCGRWLLVVATAALMVDSTRAENWPGFRGPTGMGHTTERGLPLTWGGPENENVLWKAPLPGQEKEAQFDHNQSSPIVWEDRVFVTTASWPKGTDRGEFPEQHVTCYRLSNGEQLWDARVPPGPWKLSDLRGGYGAPTPCTDGSRVYVLFGTSVLAALDFEGGLVWSREVPEWKNFDVAIASSPVLHNGRLYLLADRNGGKSSLTAFEPATGEPLWERERSTAFSHTTPVFIEHSGKPQMLIGGAGDLAALDPASGERLWWCSSPGDVTSPVYGAGLVYSDSGRGGPGVCVDPSGTGDVRESHVKWRISNLPEGLSSPLVVGETLYRSHNPGVVKCLNMKTGDEHFRERLEGVSVAASPIAVPEGRIYFASAGKSYVLAAGEKFEVLAVNDLGEPHHASPAVSGSRLLLKGSRHLFCIGTK